MIQVAVEGMCRGEEGRERVSPEINTNKMNWHASKMVMVIGLELGKMYKFLRTGINLR